VVEREFCDRHVPAADRRLYPILEDYVQRARERSPIEDSFVDVVATAIEAAVPNGEPQLMETAGAVGVSGRTLQRRLNEAGIEYKTLVGAIRRRLALRYLRDRKHTLSEVAYLLGYSEISAFSRAFKRWTGSTPSEHRRRG
jgi:AraC-like DNA-binding protein